MNAKKKIHPISRKEIMHSYDPLEEIEREESFELPERVHEKAEKPTKLPKKVRSSPKESYFPLHRR